MQYACKKLFNQWIEINCSIQKKKKVELELELKIFKLILFQENGHHWEV